MSNEKKTFKIESPVDAYAYLQELDEDILLTLMRINEVALLFYREYSDSKDDPYKSGVSAIKLLADKPKGIVNFRKHFKDFILINGDVFNQLKVFPEDYSCENKKLTKNEQGELNLYNALNFCYFAKMGYQRHICLSQANVLIGQATALLRVNPSWVDVMYIDKQIYDLGGEIRAQKSRENKEKAYSLFKAGGYTSYASCARDICDGLGVKDPMTVSRWLSEMDKSRVKQNKKEG